MSWTSPTFPLVDISCTDFSQMANILARCDQERLKTNPLAYLLNETKDFWRYRVRSTADVFVDQEKGART